MDVQSSNARGGTARPFLHVAGPRDALLSELREACRHWLGARLRATLSRLDDVLFEKAVNAAQAGEQNLYFDAMRELRLHSAEFITAAAKYWLAQIDRYARTLNGDDDVNFADLVLALHESQSDSFRAMAHRTATTHGEALSMLNELLNGLAGRQCVSSQVFALMWPSELCAACAYAAAEVKLDIRMFGVLYQEVEYGVFQELDELSAHLVGLLLDSGVAAPRNAVRSESADELPGDLKGLEQRRQKISGLLDSASLREHYTEHLFNALQDDELIPGPIRTMISRLKPLVVRLGEHDAGILADRRHPLACLINEIGALSFGWQARDAGWGVLLERIESLVMELCRCDTVSREVLLQELRAWRTYALGETRRVTLAQRRAEEAENGALLSASANAAVDALVAPLERERCMPAAAVELLREGWRRVLVAAYLRSGVHGERWHQALRTLGQFVDLWSNSAYALPDALDRSLREGMTEAGVDALRIETLLSGVSEAFETWEPVKSTWGVVLTQLRGIGPVARGNKATLEKSFDDSLQPGAWYRFEGHGGTPVYGKFAAYVGEARALLFVDREGRKLACYTRAQFDTQMQLHRASTVAARAWFDTAADTALANMRKLAKVHAA